MSLMPATPAMLTPETDATLSTLIDQLLRSQGVTLETAQISRIAQEDSVLQFLRNLVEIGRRHQDEITVPGAPSLISNSTQRPIDLESVSDVPLQSVAACEPPSPACKPAGIDQGADVALPDQSDFTPADQGEPEPKGTAAPAAESATSPPSFTMPEPRVEGASTPNGPSSVPPAAVPPSGAHQQQRVPKPLPKLRLPNGTAETPYSHRFDLTKFKELAEFRVVDLIGLDSSGLAFDPAGPLLQGTPNTEPGKSHEFTFSAKLERKVEERSEIQLAHVSLFINPHPRSLWKEIDPDPSLPFQKPHRRSMDLYGGGLRAVAASVRGRSHANSGTFREDDFHLRHDLSGTWTVIAVADGAGSAKLSRRGSQIATEQSVEVLATSLPAIDTQLEAAFAAEPSGAMGCWAKAVDSVRQLLGESLGRAAFQASKAIKAEAAALKVEEKALSATLLLAAVRPYGDGLLIATYWIGDGALAVIHPETATLQLLGDADSGEYSGQTRFLLSSEFAPQPWEAISKRVRCVWVPAGSVLVLMSDGVSDPKFGTDNALKDADGWHKWWRDDLAVNLSRDNAALATELETYLGFWSQGEHDDRTLALVY
jgi:serine/threonine protein phosphatase PrpC